MKMARQDIDDISVISISGRIDSISSPDLDLALNEAMDENSRIVIDLADTEYMSSSGLRVLLAGLKALKRKQGDMALISLQPVVRDVFEITGLARLFTIQKDLEEAVNSMKSKR